MCKADPAKWCVPHMMNCIDIVRTTNTTTTRTPAGDAWNVVSPRKDMSKMEDTSMQKVGMHNDRENEMYESYMSWEQSL